MERDDPPGGEAGEGKKGRMLCVVPREVASKDMSVVLVGIGNHMKRPKKEKERSLE